MADIVDLLVNPFPSPPEVYEVCGTDVRHELMGYRYIEARSTEHAATIYLNIQGWKDDVLYIAVRLHEGPSVRYNHVHRANDESILVKHGF